LFALALQFGLSFGHTHALHSPQPIASLTAPAADGSSPLGNHDDDDNYCSICAVLALLTNAQTASAPVVVPPVVLAAAELPPLSETILSGLQRVAFRSRAPPQA
jgi:hypothetical protein